MSADRPDFSSYSTKELREILGVIDRQKYPDRVEEVLGILADREHARASEPNDNANRHVPEVVSSTTTIDGTSVKRGRSVSLMEGIGSIIFGVLWLFALAHIFETQPKPPPLAFKLLFYGAGVASIGGGLVAIYNAFSRNRFSLFDAVSTKNEPDPLSSYLDPDKRERSDD